MSKKAYTLSPFQKKYPDDGYFTGYLRKAIEERGEAYAGRLVIPPNVIRVLLRSRVSPYLYKRYMVAISPHVVTWWWESIKKEESHLTKQTVVSKKELFEKYTHWRAPIHLGKPVKYISFCTAIRSAGVIALRHRKGQEQVFQIPAGGVASFALSSWSEIVKSQETASQLVLLYEEKAEELDKMSLPVV